MNNILDKIRKNYDNLTEKGYSLNIDSIYVEQENLIEKLIMTNDTTIHKLKSCSKLLISMAMGIAIEKNLFTLDERVYPIISNIINITNNSNLEKIKKWTIKDLLLHQTGYEKQMMSERYIQGIDKNELLEYALNYDIPYNPGERFAYNNVEPFIISVIFMEKYKIDIEEFIKENIFSKIGIENYEWKKYGKYCPAATGLYLNHNDFHKLGKLLLNDGMYNNVQVISKEWINELLKLQLETPSEYKSERVLPKVGVGYYTFISRDGYIFRDGAEGQYIILNKDKNLLITIFSDEKEMKNITEILRDII